MQGTPQFLIEDTARHDRWAHLTESLQSDKYMKAVVETIMDNTKAWAESANTTQNVQAFTTFAFPLIRRIFPSLVANQLVSIQPLTMPSGMIFYFNLKYGSNISPTKRGDRMEYGVGQTNAEYASGRIRGLLIGTGDGSNKIFKVKGYSPINKDSVIGYVNSAPATISEITEANAGYMNAEGEVILEFATAPSMGASVTVDFNQIFEGNGNAPEVEFDMDSSTISTEQKRLKAKWTLEAQQDLFAYHGLDAEAELTAVLGDEIRREIDRLIIDDLYANATAGNVNWSQTKPVEFDGSTKEYNQTLMEALVDAENLIYKKRLVRPNFVVAHPDVLNRLEKTNAFRYQGDVQGGQIQKGANVFGTLAGKYNVIADPLAPTNKILMGYRGNSFLETGYVYAPYQPITTTPTIVDVDFQPRKAVMSRFGRKVISGDFYSTVTVTA